MGPQVRLKSRLVKNGFQRRVMEAIFDIEKSKGSLFGRHSNPQSWGYASRKWIAKRMGIAQSDRHLRLISMAGIILAKKKILRRKVVAIQGDDHKATHFLFMGWAFIYICGESVGEYGSKTYGSSGAWDRVGVKSFSEEFQKLLDKREGEGPSCVSSLDLSPG